MRIELDGCVIRSWRHGDVDALVHYANDREISRQLRDQFPHPYTRDDAVGWLSFATTIQPETHFAIACDDEAIGGIGYQIGSDIARCSAEIGYWVARRYWGRGIATEAVGAVTALAVRTHRLARVFALPFASNAASIRVLEKNGFVLEGCLRQSAIKEGRVVDQLMYAYIAPS